MKVDLSTVSILAELERLKWGYEHNGSSEIRCKCPAHEDSSPSCNVNLDKGVWKCHAAKCGKSGDIASFLAYANKTDRTEAIKDLSDRYDIEKVKAINLQTIEKYHKEIWSHDLFLEELRKRGVTDEDICKARLGVDRDRITIPVFDASGRCRNIRRYLPGAPAKDKVKNTRGYGEIRIYQEKGLKQEKIWICGGEIKALVVSGLLSPFGIGAVALTGGEGNWSAELADSFKDKDVYICYDIDAGGKVGSRQVALALQSVARSITIIDLPLDPEKYPKGDVNDFVGSEKASAEDLLSLAESGTVWEPVLESQDSRPEAFESVSLSRASSAELVGRGIEVLATVSALDQTPYLIPSRVLVSCDRKQANCPFCPVRASEPDPESGAVELTISRLSAGVLGLCGVGKSAQREATREALKIPPCRSAAFTVKDHLEVRDVRLTPRLDLTVDRQNQVIQTAFIVEDEVELNSSYRFQGRVHPSPKNQQAVLLFDQSVPVEDNLESFRPSETELEELKVFQPPGWSSQEIEHQLGVIWEDLSRVTRIYQRPELHAAMDVGFFSPLLMSFEGSVIKGWTNVLVLGDSAQGKSEASLRLMELYGVGERVECKNASVAGLLGGLQKLGDRWFASWGVIPTHDRRCVIMEEIKGTSTEVLAKLTDMRSSGIAEIPKIERQKSAARTRLIMLSNPRSNRPLASYNFGVEAIMELVGGPEDVRRFDFATVLQTDEVEIDRLHVDDPLPPVFQGSLHRRLLLWTWTLEGSQVLFEDESFVREKALELCNEFTENAPLVDRGTMRHKLARLSAVFAARTFSTEDRKLLVRSGHVEFCTKFLRHVYSKPAFGYREYSRAIEYANNIRDPESVKKRVMYIKHAEDFIDSLLYTDGITLEDIANWLDVERQDAQGELSFLVRKHCLRRGRRNTYFKTPGFISLLRDVQKEGIPEKPFGEIESEGDSLD